MSDFAEKVREGYEYDLEHNAHPVTRRDQLPIAFDYITDVWLTDVLCHEASGAKVIGHELGNVDDGSTNRRKIALRYNEAGKAAGLPERLFCKAAHGLANRVILSTGGAAAECGYYNLVRPHLDIESPVSYFATLDERTWNSMILLGDISDNVSEFCNKDTVMTRARAESQMRLLARLHGKCYSDPALVPAVSTQFLTWPQYFEQTMLFGMKEGSEEGFRRAGDVLPPALYARASEIWPATMKSVAFHDTVPRTLAHHDVHLKNWYVASNGEMGLSDWACAVHAHWSRDFAYTIATALTIEDRRAWEKDLLRYYLDQLHKEGGPKVAFDEGWLHYRQQLITALTWWTITLNPAEGMPDMQPLDITLQFLNRIGTAMDDVGTMDALRD